LGILLVSRGSRSLEPQRSCFLSMYFFEATEVKNCVRRFTRTRCSREVLVWLGLGCVLLGDAGIRFVNLGSRVEATVVVSGPCRAGPREAPKCRVVRQLLGFTKTSQYSKYVVPVHKFSTVMDSASNHNNLLSLDMCDTYR
jgi:hypothetical protein